MVASAQVRGSGPFMLVREAIRAARVAVGERVAGWLSARFPAPCFPCPTRPGCSISPRAGRAMASLLISTGGTAKRCAMPA